MRFQNDIDYPARVARISPNDSDPCLLRDLTADGSGNVWSRKKRLTMKTSIAKRAAPARCDVLVGDSHEVLRQFPDNHFDALVTDPPAEIHFMSLEFDSNRGGRNQWIAWLTEVIEEVKRVLKPGAHALVWALPRTSHWTAMALENGGLEIRDSINHLFGTGMPKGLAVDKAIDKSQGAKREVVGARKGRKRKDSSVWREGSGFNASLIETTIPASNDAKEWAGWSTSLKPGHEVWWLARKPLSEKTVATNVLRWGTGAVNIRATAVKELGRYPTNTVLSHLTGCNKKRCLPGCVVAALNAQAGWRQKRKDAGWDSAHGRSHLWQAIRRHQGDLWGRGLYHSILSRILLLEGWSKRSGRGQRPPNCEKHGSHGLDVSARDAARWNRARLLLGQRQYGSRVRPGGLWFRRNRGEPALRSHSSTAIECCCQSGTWVGCVESGLTRPP